MNVPHHVKDDNPSPENAKRSPATRRVGLSLASITAVRSTERRPRHDMTSCQSKPLDLLVRSPISVCTVIFELSSEHSRQRLAIDGSREFRAEDRLMEFLPKKNDIIESVDDQIRDLRQWTVLPRFRLLPGGGDGRSRPPSIATSQLHVSTTQPSMRLFWQSDRSEGSTDDHRITSGGMAAGASSPSPPRTTVALPRISPVGRGATSTRGGTRLREHRKYRCHDWVTWSDRRGRWYYIDVTFRYVALRTRTFRRVWTARRPRRDEETFKWCKDARARRPRPTRLRELRHVTKTAHSIVSVSRSVTSQRELYRRSAATDDNT